MALECKAGRTVRDSVIFAEPRNVPVPGPMQLGNMVLTQTGSSCFLV